MSLKVFVGRLMRICREMIDVVRFDGFCMFVILVGSGFNNISGFID